MKRKSNNKSKTKNSAVYEKSPVSNSESSLTLESVPGDVILEIIKVSENDIYIINNNYHVLYANHPSRFYNDVSRKSINAPCYKLIFNLESPCPYCGFSFEHPGESEGAQKQLTKTNIRIKNHAHQESEYKDFILSQQVITKKSGPYYIDTMMINSTETIYDAGDQLVTLGAHVQTVAHELSNPITGLNLTRQQIARILDSNDLVSSVKLKPLTDLLLKDIRRAASVLSEIRNYSRPVSKSYRMVQLKSILKSALENVTRIYKNDKIKVDFKWSAEEDFSIPGNAAKLEQCFINIIKNSFEMFDLGKNHPSPHVHIIAEKTEIPEMLKIQIIDNAGGISNDALSNVFKPYFTTKERFRGLGLGLYIAGKILKEHQSSITIESKGGKTTVAVYMKKQEYTK